MSIYEGCCMRAWSTDDELEYLRCGPISEQATFAAIVAEDFVVIAVICGETQQVGCVEQPAGRSENPTEYTSLSGRQ